MEKKYDIFSIGNALVDLIIQSSEKKLEKFGMHKGGIIFLEEKKAKDMIDFILKDEPQIIPGGSSANVISMANNLGSKTFYGGKVGNDILGEQFEEVLKKEGIETRIEKDNLHTGTAITAITPDKERSFAVYLGASTRLKEENIDFEALKESKLIHIEGYQFYDKNLRNLILKIAKIAKENNVMISFDFSSYDLVEQHRSELKFFIEEYVDIIFANEEEAESYTGKNPDESVEEFSKIVKIAIVKIGEEGSLIKTKGEFYKINGVKTDIIDTNGAGDAYAGAFLHSYVQEKSISECGNLASFAAAKIVSSSGARLQTSIKEEIAKILLD